MLNDARSTDRPQARATQVPPAQVKLFPTVFRSQRAIEREAEQAKIRALESDWLWKGCSLEGRRRLMREHGLWRD